MQTLQILVRSFGNYVEATRRWSNSSGSLTVRASPDDSESAFLSSVFDDQVGQYLFSCLMIEAFDFRKIQFLFAAPLRSHLFFVSLLRVWASDGSDMEITTLPPVKALTSSDESDDSRQRPEAKRELPRRKKRKVKSGAPLKERMSDEAHLRNMLQKRCGGSCSKACLKPFLRKHLFKEFLDFRQELSGMYKLDSDKLVAC